MTIEQQIKSLNNEADSLKATFEMSANTIPVNTTSIDFQTSENTISLSIPGEYSYSYFDYERIIVTFNTYNGANTLAKIELTTDAYAPPVIRQVPYSGGAKWIVTGPPKVVNVSDWATTTYRFTVHSAIRGELSARMYWQ